MTGMADVVVGFWFLPVILNIIIPLIMLFGWAIGRLIMPRKRGRQVAVRQEDQVVQSEIFAKA